LKDFLSNKNKINFEKSLKMKKITIAISLLVSSVTYAVEGYKDIYIDRERDIIIHGIVCGEDINNLRSFKPSYVFTNTDTISNGTYYYNSPYGNYSLTFKATENMSIMARGLLKSGQTKKDQMVKNVCIVSKLDGLPGAISKNLNKLVLKANDPNWDEVMTKHTFVSGKPAYGEGIFQNDRDTAKFDQEDKEVFDANQKYLKEIEKIFSKEYKEIAGKLPIKLVNAIKYTHQTDGFSVGKTYPLIEEPAVWTSTAKERYNDLNRRRTQTIDWDKVIQENFNWFFGLVGRDNKLKTTHLVSTSKPQWNGRILEQLATVQAKFEDGKSLELDFLITSSKVNSEMFDTIEVIKKKSHLVRNNPIASSKTPRKPVELPSSKAIDVYTPTEKEVNFFSLFRDKAIGDTYRYQ